MKDTTSSLLPIILLTLPLAWFAGCSHQETARQETTTEKEVNRSQWIDSTLQRLTLEEKIGQMVMSRAYGYYYSQASDENKRIERLVKENKVGGFVFFQGDVYETAETINRLQRLSDLPLLISSDMEWGAAMRIRRTTRFPEAMALGASRDTGLAFEIGKAIGEEARALGIGQDYAPDADVNINPDNPVINTRSFGENPDLVAGMAGAFAAGIDSGGALATAKHFPGHGDTRVDSHLDLPVIDVTRERLDSIELVPFKRLVQRRVPSIMVAHLVVPALEPNRALPSTLSRAIIGDLLESTYGYDGLVVTDAMEMGAVVNRYGTDSSAIRAVEAGVDIMILLPDEGRGIAAIAAAVRSGRISEERINRSVRKILGAKWDLGLPQKRTVELDSIALHVEIPAHLQLAKRAARAGITLVKDHSILPIDRFGRRHIGVLIVADVENYRTEIHRPSSPLVNELVGEPFLAQFRKRYSNLDVVRVDPSINDIDLQTAMKTIRRSDLLVCAIYSKARSGSGQMGLGQMLTRFLDTLNSSQKPIVALAMGSPYALRAIPFAGAMVCAYSDAEAMNEAAVELLFGEIAAQGKLPVTIPGIAPYGAGSTQMQTLLRSDQPEAVGFNRDSLARIDALIKTAIADSAFPGAEVLVAKDGGIVLNKAYGRLEYDAKSPPVNPETMYDLASVTKVIATTSAIMRLYDEGKLALDDSVVKYIPEFGNHGKEAIRIRNLLLHNGGLPAFKRLFLTCNTPRQALDSVYQTETIYRVGDSTVYSDFDFIMLGKIVERISGASLDRYVDSVFFKPLHMDRTMYNPSAEFLADIAPTEYDSVFRKGVVRGVVHDENAYILGGVSGHAGLFSDASDLAIYMQMLMNGGTYAGKQYLKPETISLFTSRQSSSSTRALGWETKTMNGYSTAGSLFSARAFGHLGFTGTSIWADPARNLFVIFLTNRVYPTRANNKIQKVRPVLHDEVIRALVGKTEVVEGK